MTWTFGSKICFPILVFGSLILPLLVWARIAAPPGEEDIHGLAEHAPLVFRGEVASVDLSTDERDAKEGTATIAVDRWYRSDKLHASSTVRIRFAWSVGIFLQGHDCSNLVAGSHWIFFARPGTESVLELFDDCEGALTISPLLAADPTGDILSRMEADFRAGLLDSDVENRIVSIQRLASLGSPASRGALHKVIANGTEIESKWALFAALKTGDISTLSSALPLLLSLHPHGAHSSVQADGTVVNSATPYPEPEGQMAVAVQKLRNPQSVPALIRLLDHAPDPFVRDCASTALMEIKDTRSLDAFAHHLSDSSQYVRYNSLVGMANITQAPECAVTNSENAERAEARCRQWWDSHH